MNSRNIMTRPDQYRVESSQTSRQAPAFALASAIGLLLAMLWAPASAQTISVLHSFTGAVDGGYPQAGLTMDRAGNLYGTTSKGGLTGSCSGAGCGTVFRMVRKGSSWVLFPLYDFPGGADGQEPEARVIVGPDGTLYGTTLTGGEGRCAVENGCGVVFNLRPAASACKAALCPWTETVLYRFSGGTDGGQPSSGDLVFDPAGNLYGATVTGGYFGGDCAAFGCGVIYKLTPSNGSWTESVIYAFMGDADGANPQGPVIPDASGNLYGITATGGTSTCDAFYSCGTVFQLSPSQSGWTKSILYSFTGINDGGFPFAGLSFDGSGNLYGSTSSYGQGGGGTVFELTPSNGSWAFSIAYGLTGPYQGGPWGPLVLDQAGDLYGAALHDGAYGAGSVFELKSSDGSWLFTDLYDFDGGKYGSYPYDGLVLDAHGNLYGTAAFGGQSGYGVVFAITP